LNPLAPNALRHAAITGRMSPEELALWPGLAGAAREADLGPNDPALDNLALPTTAGVGLVDGLADVGIGAGGDHGLSLGLVHDDQSEPEAFEPPAQGGCEAPGGAATAGPAEGLELGGVTVRPVDPVIEGLLGNPKRLAAAAKEAHERVLIANQNWANRHLNTLNKERPHD